MDYEEELIKKAAWYYYFEKMTQQTISEKLGISRMKVIKLLDKAHQSGMIQFKIREDSTNHMETEKLLMEKYKLNDVFIVPCELDNADVNQTIAKAAAMYINDRVNANCFINIGYGNTVSKVLDHLDRLLDSPISCVSLTGGVNNYIRNNLLNTSKLKMHLIPAPLLTGSMEMAKAIGEEKSVRDIERLIGLSALTVVGIGGLDESATILRSGILGKSDLLYLKMQGAVGDILSHFFDKNGKIVSTDFEKRLISTPLKSLHNFNTVIGVSGGVQKIDAIRAALNGNYLNVLITDENTALLLKD